MKVGDLVTWKSDVLNDKVPLEYGVIIGYGAFGKKKEFVWVKFTNGQHAHKRRTLCKVDHILLVEDIKQKRT